MDHPRHNTGAVRRALAHALKRLFKTIGVRYVDGSPDAPVDIIRKDISRASYSSCLSEVSLFPEFERADLDCGAINHHPSLRAIPVPVINASPDSRKALLPAKSFSHFNLRQIYSEQGRLPPSETTRADKIHPREMVDQVPTGRVTSSKPVLVSQKSTLQIRRPDSQHASTSNARLEASFISDSSSSVIRRSKGSSNLRKCASDQASATGKTSLTSITEHSRPVASATSQEDPSHLVRQFASFCVLDLQVPGCPVSAVSEDLRYVYDIRDRFVLNAHECSELSMDFSVGRDPDGNEVTYVLLFSPLVSAATARSRFMLVSAIDVSGYVRYAASLDSGAERRDGGSLLTSFNERSQPRPRLSRTERKDERADRLADELLHGCSIKDNSGDAIVGTDGVAQTANLVDPTSSSDEDVWIEIAKEEGLMPRKAPGSSTSPAGSVCKAHGPTSSRSRPKATVPAKPPKRSDCADEKVLGNFIESLQVLYSQYFLLACSSLTDDFYEICYVSPAVYASGEHVIGHLSHMPLHCIHDFGAHLAAGKRFRTTIRWGNLGTKKQLYCVPLIGKQPTPWICMLVEPGKPIHW